MGCDGCKEGESEFKDRIVEFIKKKLLDLEGGDIYDVLILDCGSLIIFIKGEFGDTEMFLQTKVDAEVADNYILNVKGNVLHPTREEIEFNMKLKTPNDENIPLTEESIIEMSGKYIDERGNVFELRNS